VRPHDFIVLNNLGVVYYNQDKFAKAQECWEDALRQRDDPRTRHQLASAYWKQGKTPQALKAFRVNLRDHPDFIPSYINCGILLGEIGQAQEALQVFQDGVKRDPDEPLLRLNLAVAWFQRQNLEQAEAEVRKVLAKQPNHPTAQKMLQAIRQARGP
jgi:tetratricopeptide (TPR) repeat protein